MQRLKEGPRLNAICKEFLGYCRGSLAQIRVENDPIHPVGRFGVSSLHGQGQATYLG